MGELGKVKTATKTDLKPNFYDIFDYLVVDFNSTTIKNHYGFHELK